MKLHVIHVKKLDDRSKPVVYLGMQPGNKDYRLYDPNSGFVHCSRDVVFEEEKGWLCDEERESNALITGTTTVMDFQLPAEDVTKDVEIAYEVPMLTPQ